MAVDLAENGSSWIYRSFTIDTLTPNVTITTPKSGEYYQNMTQATGTAGDETRLSTVRISLADNATGRWWDWSADAWGGTTFYEGGTVR